MYVTTWIKGSCLAGALALGAMFTSGTAEAGSIIGGETAVTVTANLAGLGLGATPVGSAFPDGGAVVFPITGGSSSGGTLLIEHDGSGVNLFDLMMPSTNVTAGNFLIDAAQATVFGDAKIGDTDLGMPDIAGAPFFTFGSGMALPGIQLLISDELGAALQAVFPGSPSLAGAEFGYAVTMPQAVPLPAGAALLLGGLGVLGIAARRKARS
jgi:hypothetical protein